MTMYDERKRNALGIVGWLSLSVVINVLALVPMVLRERRQAKEGGFALEWDDILRYGGAIAVGSSVNGLLWQWLLGG